MIRACSLLAFVVAFFFVADASSAAAISPAGKWITIDDNTGRAKSIIWLWEENGTLFGKVAQVLDAEPGHPAPKCNKCSGDLKDKPILGMRIIWNLSRNGDEWSGGKVLDPSSGNTYSCTVSLEDGGDTLKLRGYLGISLLGRTQYWKRIH